MSEVEAMFSKVGGLEGPEDSHLLFTDNNNCITPEGEGAAMSIKATIPEVRKNKRKPAVPRCLIDPARTIQRTEPEVSLPSHSPSSNPSCETKGKSVEQFTPSHHPLDLSRSITSKPKTPAISTDEHGALDLTCSSSSNIESRTDLLKELAKDCRQSKEEAPTNPLNFPPLGLSINNPNALFNPFMGLGGAPGGMLPPFMFGYSNPLENSNWIHALNTVKQPTFPAVPATNTSSDPIGQPEEEGHRTASSSTNPSPADSLTEGKSTEGGKGKMAFYNPKSFEDSGEYIQRYGSFEDCGQLVCRQTGFRDHFHCLQCEKVLVRREEMIRHFKWHKKREESLQHGFMRYSPTDDCANEGCIHNGKQTHYHCLQTNCDKVYISTSDVQMHANFHRKDAAIIQEGFQRFRATEDCGSPTCTFHRERTTHFHCRRPDCRFTFKNKADMEKHKTHHLRNDDFAKDGFKKFIKYEHCDFLNCKYSKMMNHIHCIRPGCEYVVHSSSQILSHKRKHERRNGIETISNRGSPYISNFGGNENSNSASFTQKEHHSQTEPPRAHQGPHDVIRSGGNSDDSRDSLDVNSRTGDESIHSLAQQLSREQHTDTAANQEVSDNEDDVLGSLQIVTNEIEIHGSVDKEENENKESDQESSFAKEKGETKVLSQTEQLKLSVMKSVEQREKDEYWRSYLKRYTANDPCIAHCPLLYKDHYHCIVKSCEEVFRTKERVREHARLHTWEEEISRCAFRLCKEQCSPDLDGARSDTVEEHYHCLWPDCEGICRESDPIFSRSRHYRGHDKSVGIDIHGKPLISVKSGSSNASLTGRGSPKAVPKRRGRPPKYKKDVVVPRLELDPGSWKDDPEIGDLTLEMFVGPPDHVFCGFKLYTSENTKCVDERCMYYGEMEHFHCLRPRCHHATDNLATVNLHRREFHHYLVIERGFEFFDRNVNCRRSHCHNNRVSRHYHCVRPNCDYSFIRYNTMHQHSRKHEELERQPSSSGNEGEPGSSNLAKPSGPKSSIRSVTHNNIPQPPSLPQVTPESVAWFSQMLQSQMMYPVDLSGAPVPPVPFMLPGMMPPTSTNPHQMIQQMLLAASPYAAAMAENAGLASVQRKGQQPNSDDLTEDLSQIFNSSGTCGRPFCKLRKKDHYHCSECHQAFSDSFRMKTHLLKHRYQNQKLKTKRKPYKPRVKQESAAQKTPKADNVETVEGTEEPPAKRQALESPLEEEKVIDDTMHSSESLITESNNEIIHDESENYVVDSGQCPQNESGVVNNDMEVTETLPVAVDLDTVSDCSPMPTSLTIPTPLDSF